MTKKQLLNILNTAKYGSMNHCNLERVEFYYTSRVELAHDAVELNYDFNAVSDRGKLTLTVTPAS